MPIHDEPRVRIRAEVNGSPVDLTVPTAARLIDILRTDLALTGTKESCGIGVCGACSVLVDGRLVSACLTLAVLVDGKAVTTVEGLADGDGTLSPVQQAFLEHGGLQCGACTPGQVVSATALLAEHPSPDEALVRDWMTGNLCRCTGYRGIVESVLAAAAAQGEVS
jgi:aerobic carbon-monoxide dehydrogenase small subunit